MIVYKKWPKHKQYKIIGIMVTNQKWPKNISNENEQLLEEIFKLFFQK